MSLLLALIGGSTSGTSLLLATTTGPAVFTANITVSTPGAKTITLSTTLGAAVFHATIPARTVPDVVYLRVAAVDRTMGVNFNRFPMVVPLITRRMTVGVERLPLKVPANPRLMRAS